MKLTIEELVIFSAVVESESFTRAADRLNLAASVLSRSLKKLETKLECRLLHRTTRSISLTQEGEWLFSQAAEIISRVTDVEAFFLEEEHQPRGVVRVDAATPFTLHAIVPLISGFKQSYPEVTVVLESSESIINLVERKVDVAVRIGELESSSLKARKLGTTYRGIYASPDYIKLHGRPKNGAALTNHSCLGFTKPNKLNTWPIAGTNNDPLTVNPEIFADSGETLRQLALQGSGIACLSAFTVKQDIAEGRLLPLLKKKMLDIRIPVYLVYYSDKAVSGRVRCFIDYIAERIDLQG